MQKYQRRKAMLQIYSFHEQHQPSFPHHSLSQSTQLENKLRNHTIKR